MRQTRPVGPSDGDLRPSAGREPEGATFDATRVGGRRQRPPTFLLVFVTVIAGMVAVGLGSRGSAGGSAALGSPVALASETGTEAPTSSAGAGVVGPRSPQSSPGMAPVVTTGPGPIVIKARRHPETMFVHGDVFVERVTWVFISLQDEEGGVVGWASVSVPGAAGPGVDDGPTLRFDVELPVPPELNDGSLWIQADAYASSGQQVASTKLEVDRDGRAPVSVAPGFRPGVFFPLLDASWDDVRG